jgi:hypothetical protein
MSHQMNLTEVMDTLAIPDEIEQLHETIQELESETMTAHQYAKVEAGKSVYKPLYPPEGGPLGGFLCCQCNGVTRTKKGMLIHLATVHGIRMQLDIEFDTAATATSPPEAVDLDLPERPTSSNE